MLAMKKLRKNFVSGLIALVISATSYAQEWQYVVKEGDSLWTIANEYLIHESYVRRLQKYNDVANPLILQPGQMIIAPVEWLGNLPSSAKVLSVSGMAEVLNNNQKNKIENGYELQANDQLITGEDGSLKIEFSDKSVLNVYSNTSLLFKTMKQSHDGSVINVKVDIERGRVNVLVNPNKDAGHRLEIESPSAVTAVRGTQFRIGVDPETNNSVTEVLKGRVDVSAQQVSKRIKELYGTKVEQGTTPIKPVKLLEGPELDLQDVIETKVATLKWNEIEGAQMYRVRVSSNDNSADILYDNVVASTEAQGVSFAQDGQFNVSVRGIDKNEIEGIDSVAKLKVNARPEPPLIISPNNKVTIFNASPEFLWSAPADGIERSRFQIALKPDFSKIIFDQTFVSKTGYSLEDPLAEGQYYWRIANLDAEGQGPYSLISTFTVKSQPELASEISDSDSKVKLNLPKDPSVSKYHVQVSRNDKFTKLIFDDWVEGEEFAFDTSGAGSYYIRLGILENESGAITFSLLSGRKY